MTNRGTLTGLRPQPVFPIPPGVIWEYGGDSLPDPAVYGEWLWADNALVSRAKYPNLFKAVGFAHTPGSPGTDPGGGNFYLPNRKGNTGVGKDTGQSEFDTLGKAGGSKTTTAPHDHTLSSHTHALTGHDHSSNNHNHVQNDHWHSAGTHGHTVNGHSHGGGTGVHAHTLGGMVQTSTGSGHIHDNTGNQYASRPTGSISFASDPPETDSQGIGNTNESPGTGGPSAGTSWTEGYLNVGGNVGNATAAVTGTTNVGTAQGPSTPNSGASSAGQTSGNLQPYVVCNYIVKV